MDPRELRNRAIESFTKGRFARAGELYEAYCAQDPKDLQARLRMGDAWSRAGQRNKAIASYQAAAEAFAKEGFLARAIAAGKLILELDPSHQGVQRMLADLYARRSAEAGSPRPAAEPLSAAMTSMSSRHAPIDLPPEDPADAVPLSLEEALTRAAEQSVAPEPEVASEYDSVEVSTPYGEPVLLAPEGESGLPPELDVSLSPPAPTRAPSGPAMASAAATPQPDADSVEVTTPYGGRIAALHEEGPELELTPEMEAPGARDDNDRADAPVPAPVAHIELTPEMKTRLPAAAPGSEGVDAFDLSRFDELSLEDAPTGDQSLLHAVEVAALAGRADRGESVELETEFGGGEEGDEEEVFSLTTEIDPVSPAVGLLPRIPLFSDLTPEAFVQLVDRCPLRRLSEGAQILRQGTVGDAFYVVCEGAVRVVRERPEGVAMELAVLKEGAFFGEMALLSGAPRSASVYSAAEDTQVLEISAPLLADLSRSYPAVAEALRTFCRQRLLSNVMASSALFTPFSRSDRRALVQRFRAREAPRGTTVVQEGAETDGLYVILSGEVEVTRGGNVLARLREGELFGEMSLLRKTPATASVTTTRRTSLLRLPRADFDALVMSHPQILILVAELTDDRQRHTDAMLGGGVQPGEGEAELVLF